MMKKILSTIMIIFCLSNMLKAQPKEAEILKFPTDWGFERMDFPLGFAPKIDYKGFEEIRFAPGMMDTTSANYFTYAFVVAIEGQKNIQKKGLQDFLDTYYKGLCISVGQPKKIYPDTALVKSEVKEMMGESSISPPLYSASLPYFDTFSNGRKILLNMEIEVNVRADKNKTYLTVLVSPSKEKAIWEKLYEIRKSLVL